MTRPSPLQRTALPGPVRFGPAELRPAERVLLVDGQPASLGGRAFDLLVTLVAHRDQVLGKNELLDLVWPGLVVEENNLSVQMSALRKCLGPHAIATVPGRGYRFTATLEPSPGVAPGADAAALPMAPVAAASAPVASSLFGREHDVQSVRRLMTSARVVSIVGAAGVGKTSLAQSIISHTADALRATWIELAPLTGEAQLLPRIADALGVDVSRDEALAELIESLARTTGWVVLDNCEHLLVEVRELLARALARAPGVRWLVTSQQPLHLRGEHVYRLDSLAVPPPGITLPSALEYSAVALLAARAAAAHRHFALDAANIDAAIELCRQLDGIPLAIEMAAARVPALGLRGVLQRLGPHLLSLAGAAAAPSRQRTLHAALEWSHSLLAEPEQVAFRRLAPFTGGFSAELAEALLGAFDGAACDSRGSDALDALATLVDKSLVQVDRADPPRYRLLESARAFAQERLDAAGERELAQDRHAEAIAARFELAREGADTLSEIEWLATHVVERDNVWAALAWMCRREEPDTTARLIAYKGLIEQFTQVFDVVPGLARAFELVERATPASKAEALLWTAHAEFARGEYKSCSDLLPRALAHYRMVDDRRSVMRALSMLARAIWSTAGDLEKVPAILAELAALDGPDLPVNLRMLVRWAHVDIAEDGETTTRGLRELIARAVRAGACCLAEKAVANLSDQLNIAGDYAGACDIAQEAFPWRLPRPTAVTMANRAAALVMLGRFDEACVEFTSALRVFPNFRIMHFVLYYLAHAALQQGRLSDAALIHGFVTAYAANLDLRVRGLEAETKRRTALALAASFPADELARRLAEGASLSQEEVLAIALPEAGDAGLHTTPRTQAPSRDTQAPI